jgi:hypothetical protein
VMRRSAIPGIRRHRCGDGGAAASIRHGADRSDFPPQGAVASAAGAALSVQAARRHCAATNVRCFAMSIAGLALAWGPTRSFRVVGRGASTRPRACSEPARAHAGPTRSD